MSSNQLYHRVAASPAQMERWDRKRTSLRGYSTIPDGFIETTEDWVVRQMGSTSPFGQYFYTEKRNIEVRLGDVLKVSSLELDNPPFCYYKPKTVAPEDYNVRILMDLYWMDSQSGYAIAPDFWDGKFRYFRFGCKHQDVVTQILGRGHSSHLCKDCGRYWEEDSTD